MGRVLILLFGLVSYGAFVVAIVYAVGFLANAAVPKGIDDGAVQPLVPSLIVNTLLLALFAVQHTIMARPGFKRWWTQFVPQPMERSIFVLAASLILILLFWQWRPLPTILWHVESATGRAALWTVFGLGFALVLYSSFLINHFDLFGLRQVVLHLKGRAYAPVDFQMPPLYRWLRHPLMLGFLLAFWMTPTMTIGHLLFAALSTAYIFIGIQFEERDLRRTLGENYEQYRRKTSMIIPRRPKSPDAA